MRLLILLAALLLPAATAAADPCRPTAALPVPQPTPAQIAAGGLGRLPLAPADRRADLVAPPFSDSTAVTNPLFPIAGLRSAILNGRADGRPLKIETTLLPHTRVVEWAPGQCVRTLVSQFVAYEGGRIKEVALDLYAQADDGSVWYFGEDVFNYERGVVADTAGSWLAGKEGPAAMIMPGRPQVGQVIRPENIPGLVFEEVTVKRTGVTVDGPRGPVQGAMIAGELHDDGSREDKFFAPGYGEFRSAGGGDLEAMALALPTDATDAPEPPELARIGAAAARAYEAQTARGRRAPAADAAAARRALSRGDLPPRLVAPLSRALKRLARSRAAALAAGQATLDLQLRYRPPEQVDRARFALWVQRAQLDLANGNRAGLRGDVATLTWIRDRMAHTLADLDRIRLDRALGRLEAALADGELRAAARQLGRLRSAASP